MIKLCTISDSQALLEISYKTFDETFRVQNKPENMDAYLKTNFTAKKLSDELKKPHSYFYFVFHQEAIAGYLKLKYRRCSNRRNSWEYNRNRAYLCIEVIPKKGIR
ncbi:Spermidine/spermine N(1)-acetyltransferase [Listeria monocytogenes]|nr:Spermidine/spermine N(1)-acetyltransferase [Listeria monocytogenes]